MTLELVFERSGNEFVVSDDVLLVYGSGDTRTAAFKDYIVSLIEYMEILDRDKKKRPLVYRRSRDER